MKKRQKLVTVRNDGEGDFSAMCNSLLEVGYVLSSSCCGFVNSESYNFIDVWMAIFVLPDSHDNPTAPKESEAK